MRCFLEKAMAPHCSTLAWKIPWTEEPGGLESMGSQKLRPNWVMKHSHATAYTPMKTILKHTFNIKKRWQECKEELYKKDFHDPDNHNGVITHLEPDILECKVNWALGSITMDKANGGDGIQISSFKSWKMMLWKRYTQYARKFGKLSSGHRIGKSQFLFQSQRKAMPKNA